MSDLLTRAELLLEQARFADAETAARRALAADPYDGSGHAVLALALMSQKKLPEALAEARKAIQFAPALGFAHYVMGAVLLEMDEYPMAAKAAREAIRLDTENPSFFWLLSAVQLAQSQWQQALQAAEKGLQIDPEHAGCLNVRTTALTNLGRHDEAHQAIQHALYESPDNAYTHLVTGISHMHRGNHAQALEHFRETLRLDPTIDAARKGIIECLKARNIVYRCLLAFFLWLSRKGSTFAGALIIGAFILVRVLNSLADAHPALRPFITPITILYVLFAFLTWTGDSLFNLLLRVDREGRMALDKDQIRASNYVGTVVGSAVVLIVLGILLGSTKISIAGFGASMLIVPIAATFRSSRGWPRKVMGAYTLAMVVCGLLAAISGIASEQLGDNAPWHKPLKNLSLGLGGCFLLGAVLSSWVGNFIMTVSPNWSVGRFLRSKRGLALMALLALVLISSIRDLLGAR